MKIFQKDNQIKSLNRIVIIKDGMQILNPTEEMVLEDGWVEFKAPEPTVEELLVRSKKDKIREIEEYYAKCELEGANEYQIEESKKAVANLEVIIGDPDRLRAVAEDFINHYETRVAEGATVAGKAMFVCANRNIAYSLYKIIVEMRPEWAEKKACDDGVTLSEKDEKELKPIEKIKMVMTRNKDDEKELFDMLGTKEDRKELDRQFKNIKSNFKIAIVVDMWLTGFDVPSMATMYVYKPMHGYNLMQAIARVNRVFKDKEGGLVVDYVGIASALKAAMNEYTARDRSRYGDMDIAKTAYPKFQEKLQVCRDLFHGFDYSGFIKGSALEMAQAIKNGVNFVLDVKVPERKDQYLKEALLMRQAMSLCSSMTTDKERREQAYFEAVRSGVIKLIYGGTNGRPLSLKEINAQINELLKASIQSEGVINLFDSKTVGENFSLFDPNILEEISKMKEKNIAVEILRKLMAEQISLYKRTNVVKSEKFSEKIAKLMNAYYNGLITNEEVIKELLEAGQEIANLHKEGEKLGLTTEELAFYDALTKPQAIKDFYENETLVEMTRELTEMLRKNRTIDWQKKETARAGMRKMVKRLLKKYKYPPEGMDDAVQTVMTQCELWTDNYEQ